MCACVRACLRLGYVWGHITTLLHAILKSRHRLYFSSDIVYDAHHACMCVCALYIIYLDASPIGPLGMHNAYLWTLATNASFVWAFISCCTSSLVSCITYGKSYGGPKRVTALWFNPLNSVTGLKRQIPSLVSDVDFRQGVHKRGFVIVSLLFDTDFCVPELCCL